MPDIQQKTDYKTRNWQPTTGNRNLFPVGRSASASIGQNMRPGAAGRAFQILPEATAIERECGKRWAARGSDRWRAKALCGKEASLPT